MSIEMALIIGYSYLIIAAAPFITWVMYKISVNIEIIDKIEKVKKEPKGPKGPNDWVLSQWQVSLLGIIERLLYLTSIMAHKPEFIADAHD